jgi:uncharacterized coiled-coil protein SlyX
MTTFKNLKEATAAYNALEQRLIALEARMDLSAKFSKSLSKELKSQAVAIYKIRVSK